MYLFYYMSPQRRRYTIITFYIDSNKFELYFFKQLNMQVHHVMLSSYLFISSYGIHLLSKQPGLPCTSNHVYLLETILNISIISTHMLLFNFLTKDVLVFDITLFIGNFTLHQITDELICWKIYVNAFAITFNFVIK